MRWVSNASLGEYGRRRDVDALAPVHASSNIGRYAMNEGWRSLIDRRGPEILLRPLIGSIRWLGIDDSPAFIGEPESNGCAEPFMSTLKELCLWAEPYATIDELRQDAVQYREEAR
jgi:hypothetical protein